MTNTTVEPQENTQENVWLNISNCTFGKDVNYTDPYGTVMRVQNQSTIHINSVYLNTNAHVKIYNCTFHINTPLLIAVRTHAFTDNRRIWNSESLNVSDSKSDLFIDISDNSYLLIIDTNITHNKRVGIKSFFSGRSNSDLEMCRCIYALNSFKTHFMADDNSDVTSKDSKFTNNNSTTLFYITSGNCFIIVVCLKKTD